MVGVEETITAALTGHDGCRYQSPPLPHPDALALVRILTGGAGAEAGDGDGDGSARSPADGAPSRSGRPHP